MRHPDTVYRGERLETEAGAFVGVRVTADGAPLDMPPAHLWVAGGMEWGYGGSGPKQLAIALILDATGDQVVALDACVWFMWACVAGWGWRWSMTAGQVQQWVRQWARETPDPEADQDAADDAHAVWGGAA